MIFLEQRLHGTVNSIAKFLSLLNCVDSVDVCVTCVMRMCDAYVWVRV